MSPPLTVNLMTAGLTPGDAISNYILTTSRILRSWGAVVRIYADFIAPELGSVAQHSRFYQDSGGAILWFHFSIYSDNVEIALASSDYKIMDYHGICPPRHFTNQNPHLEFLCQKGIDLRPALHGKFDAYFVHSEFTKLELLDLGFPTEAFHKISLSIDTSKFEGAADPGLSDDLARLDYFLFVGRIVPQKDILRLIEIFAKISRQQPDAVLILVGSRQQTKKYQAQIDNLVATKGLTNRVIFTGQVNNPAVLSALFENAKLLFVTSEWESFCVPIAESLYFGVPVVVHDSAPMPEVAGPGGLIIDKTDIMGAAGKVLALLDDKPRYLQMCQKASAWAQQYTDKSLERNILALFSQMFDIYGD